MRGARRIRRAPGTRKKAQRPILPPIVKETYMAPENQQLLDTFSAKAQATSAVVTEAPNMAAALQYVVDVCENRPAAELLADEDVEKGPNGPNGVPTRVQRIIAAPDLDGADFDALSGLCAAKGFACIRQGVRKHLAGIDIGVTKAILGVAASGTCMVDADGEDARLAGMVSEVHILLLKKSEIYPDLPSIAQKLRERMNANPTTYTTFITGPSRTADIERVAAVGVHGPLELHIILLED